jgi:hypothetical protein
MVDIRAKREKPLECIRDVSFNLLWRHAVVKRGHNHHGHVDLGKKIHGHLNNIDRSHE